MALRCHGEYRISRYYKSRYAMGWWQGGGGVWTGSQYCIESCSIERGVKETYSQAKM